jgi:bile acid:Na+ symporter, BASS family
MLQRTLLVWLILLSAVAGTWPLLWPGAFDPFRGSAPLLKPLFAAVMFLIGGLLPPAELRLVRRRWPTVLGGTAVQYTAMPLLAWLFSGFFTSDPDLRLGVLLVGCVPGAMASNVLTLAARGNVSYSVSLTTSATLLSPLIVPAVLFLVLQRTGVDARQMALDAFWMLLTQVVGPVLLGNLAARGSARWRRALEAGGAAAANLAILWIIAVIVSLNRERLADADLRLGAVLLGVNLLGYASGWLGGALLRLPEGMRRALTLEIGMQNAGLGSVLATALFPEQPVTALPPALYMFGCMLTGTVLAQRWASRPVKEEGAVAAGGTANGSRGC